MIGEKEATARRWLQAFTWWMEITFWHVKICQCNTSSVKLQWNFMNPCLCVFCFLMASVLGVGLGLARTEQTLWWFPPLSGWNIQQEPKRGRYHKELHSSKKSYQQKCSCLMVGHLPSMKPQKHTFHSRKSRLISFQVISSAITANSSWHLKSTFSC